MTITKRLLYLPLLLMMIGCQWGPKEPAGEKDSVVENRMFHVLCEGNPIGACWACPYREPIRASSLTFA